MSPTILNHLSYVSQIMSKSMASSVASIAYSTSRLVKDLDKPALSISYKDWTGELTSLSQIAGILAGFVLVFATVILTRPETTNTDNAVKTLKSVKTNRFVLIIGATLWCCVAASYMLGHATGYAPYAAEGPSNRFAYLWFEGTCGCFLFGTSISLLMLCYSHFAFLISPTDRTATFALFLTTVTSVAVMFELSQTVVSAMNFMYNFRDADNTHFAVSWKFEVASLSFALAPLFALIAHRRHMIRERRCLKALRTGTVLDKIPYTVLTFSLLIVVLPNIYSILVVLLHSTRDGGILLLIGIGLMSAVQGISAHALPSGLYRLMFNLHSGT